MERTETYRRCITSLRSSSGVQYITKRELPIDGFSSRMTSFLSDCPLKLIFYSEAQIVWIIQLLTVNRMKRGGSQGSGCKSEAAFRRTSTYSCSRLSQYSTLNMKIVIWGRGAGPVTFPSFFSGVGPDDEEFDRVRALGSVL